MTEPGLGSGALREALTKLRDEASKNAASWHRTHDSSREQRAHWMTFYEGRKAAFEQALDMLAAPTQLTVPAQDEKPVIETANLVTPVGVGPGYCEDSPFSINRAALSLSSPIEPPSVEWSRHHLAHVQRFLCEMYQTMVDPVDEFRGNIAELCALLLSRAREDREALAAPTPQASSEIRELIKEWRAKADYESARWSNQGSSTAQERIDAVGDYYADALEKALAPSRQGAAKRVEAVALKQRGRRQERER